MLVRRNTTGKEMNKDDSFGYKMNHKIILSGMYLVMVDEAWVTHTKHVMVMSRLIAIHSVYLG